MTYDPQAKHQRPKPKPEGPAPVDAFLLTDTTAPSRQKGVVADTKAPVGNEELPPSTDHPPPAPTVTPEPANPPPDKLLFNSALFGAVGALVGALALRYLWKRWLRGDRPQ